MSEYREPLGLALKWQFHALDGTRFFGPLDGLSEWKNRADYPLRYFICNINRGAWLDLEYWDLPEETTLALVDVLRNDLQALKFEMAKATDEDEDEQCSSRSLIQIRTEELQDDEALLDGWDDDRLQEVGSALGSTLHWGAVSTAFTLIHVDDAVRLLGSSAIPLAAAHALKAQDWLLQGRYLRGKTLDERLQKMWMAKSGADAAHSENRRLRQRAIDLYCAKEWPSKMQAARVISAEVHRTELVVLRWIREHTRDR